jgi:hypothetical protein
VDASSINEAEEIAHEEMEIEDSDIDLDFIFAHEIKPGVKRERKELS